MCLYLKFVSLTCASRRNQSIKTPAVTPRQHMTALWTLALVSNMRLIPLSFRVLSNRRSIYIGVMIAKASKSMTVDSSRTKITETVQASHAGQLATIKACACSGNKNTKDRTKDRMPTKTIKRNGHNTLSQSCNQDYYQWLRCKWYVQCVFT